ncbi:MAG: histidine kinase, partial [Acidimicrobiia bacterium]|nr:histidine kinase [Acidimicrobiia bacterium]
MSESRVVEAAPAPGARRGEVAGELALFGIVALVQLGGTALAAAHQPERGGFGPFGVLLLAAGVAAVPFRRRFPRAVLAATFCSTLAYISLGYSRGPVFASLVVALAHTVLSGHRRAALASLGLGFVCFTWLGYAIGREPAPTVGGMLALAAWLTALASVLEVVRSRRARAQEAARSQAEALRRRATEERLRIARELHDAVAHSMSLINLQAGVALHLVDSRPEQTREALATIKTASKEALVELDQEA